MQRLRSGRGATVSKLFKGLGGHVRGETLRQSEILDILDRTGREMTTVEIAREAMARRMVGSDPYSALTCTHKLCAKLQKWGDLTSRITPEGRVWARTTKED